MVVTALAVLLAMCRLSFGQFPGSASEFDTTTNSWSLWKAPGALLRDTVSPWPAYPDPDTDLARLTTHQILLEDVVWGHV